MVAVSCNNNTIEIIAQNIVHQFVIVYYLIKYIIVNVEMASKTNTDDSNSLFFVVRIMFSRSHQQKCLNVTIFLLFVYRFVFLARSHFLYILSSFCFFAAS